jgi:hypothetical protein
MLDPFKLFGHLIVALLKIAAYFVIFIIQVAWYLMVLDRARIGDAFGNFGRCVVDALGDIAK